MKVLGVSQFVSERMKIRPVTNAELDQIQQDLENMKYVLTDETIKTDYGKALHRIKALKDIPSMKVKKGDLGGFVESYDNLDQEGDCWVADNAKACNYVSVHDNAKVYGYACVWDNAQVYGNAKACNYVSVHDNAKVYGSAIVKGNAKVYGNAKIYGNAKVCCRKMYDNAEVCNNAEVFGNAEVFDNAVVCGYAKVYGNAEIDYDVKDRNIDK